jgi:putative methyltransferase (TIGR04325 family)
MFVQRALDPLRSWVGRRRRPAAMTGNYDSWDAAVAESVCYESDLDFYSSVVERVRAGGKTHRKLTPILGALLLGGGKVLDYGGNLGFVYFEIVKFAGPKIEWWHVVDLPQVVNYGNQHFADGRLSFFDSVEGALEGAGSADVLLCSHVLQYLRDPYGTLGRLLRMRPTSVVFDELPVSDRERIFVQRFPPSLGGRAVPARILCDDEIAQVAAGYELIEELDLPAWAPFRGVRHVSRLYTRRGE